jgi:hypothetical protein
MKRGSLIRTNHELETHCKRTRDLAGSRNRWESISGIRYSEFGRWVSQDIRLSLKDLGEELVWLTYQNQCSVLYL